MKTLILKNIVKNSGSNEQGAVLFHHLQDAYLNKDTLILHVDSSLSMSSSFLNSSMGLFLDKYGLNNFKQTVKFKGSRNQFFRLSDYINKYGTLYPIN
ncbi:MAG: STAS-like domain-containing protein [Flavobacteriaceae bacterium]